MLTQERLKEVLRYEPDTGLFYRKIATARRTKVGEKAGCVAGKGYVFIGIDGITYRAHRLAWLYVYGVWPSGEIDHINGIKDDNRIANLRDVSSSVNSQNRRAASSLNKLNLLGVHRCGNKFRAQISLPGRKKKHLGVFPTEEEAYAAYLQAKRKVHEGNTL